MQKALCLLEGLIPNEENEHKESTYERSASAAALLPDVPLDVPELTLDLKGIFLKSLGTATPKLNNFLFQF